MHSPSERYVEVAMPQPSSLPGEAYLQQKTLTVTFSLTHSFTRTYSHTHITTPSFSNPNNKQQNRITGTSAKQILPLPTSPCGHGIFNVDNPHKAAHDCTQTSVTPISTSEVDNNKTHTLPLLFAHFAVLQIKPFILCCKFLLRTKPSF